jgi:hypothetical protein
MKSNSMIKKLSRNSSILAVCIVTISTLLLSGCTRELFYWGDYEDTLFERYVQNDPTQTEAQLQELIAEANSSNGRVAPGIYADYGFMLFTRGDKNGAIRSFEQERKLYPESTILMTSLIDRVGAKKKEDTSKATDILKIEDQK